MILNSQRLEGSPENKSSNPATRSYCESQMNKNVLSGAHSFLPSFLGKKIC
jgi:hypothetical protein